MNTAALKAFAPAVRQALQEAVARKLDVVLAAQSPDLRTTFAPQVAELRARAADDRATLVEQVAYTWFNRFTALRYLDARGWHPFGIRVLTAADPDATQPDLLRVTREGALPAELASHVDATRLRALLAGEIPSINPQGEVYRHLVLGACRYYHALLPNLFEKLDDATELLLPDDLLTDQAVVAGFRTEITDADCADVEVIGWLYQFYISEKKDAVMARKSAVPTEDIPAVTQLFTPHWIVRYLVENSLGRLWLLNHPGSRLREQMPYYIEGEPETEFLKIATPEEIRVCDPAAGSGHMLTYAFDLLYAIYEEEGYAAADIPGLILRHNLTGLEICPRAAQLAELALVFKARDKSRRFFQPEQLVRPGILELRDVRFTESEMRDYIRALELGDLFTPSLRTLLTQFEEAKTFGSLIQPILDARAIAHVRRAIEAKDLGGQLFLQETHRKVLRVLNQAEALTPRYHVVVANPPYMGAKGMNSAIKLFLHNHYEDFKADLFAAFIVRSQELSVRDGLLGFMSPFVWMFISSYERLRQHLICQATITSLVQLEYSGFAGATVPICAFCVSNRFNKNYSGSYVRLTGFRGSENQGPRTLEAISNPTCGWMFRATAEDFQKLPGSPIAFWLSSSVRDVFQRSRQLNDVTPPKAGISTGENGQFILFWFEVRLDSIGIGQARPSSEWQFYPHNKGGGYRRWFGYTDFILRYSTTALTAMEANAGFRHDGASFYFRPSVSWGKITSSHFSARLYPQGFTFDSAGISIFPQRPLLFVALLNSSVFSELLAPLSQTLNFTVGDIGRFPIPDSVLALPDPSTAEQALSLARSDWNNFETSWEFSSTPLLRPALKGVTLEVSWRDWEAQSLDAIRRMQELETENNRFFISAYGLEGELHPDVSDDRITLARADVRRDLAAFLSYSVGCIMGRYSLDHSGVILANAGGTLREYLAKVQRTQEQLSFAPDEDGVVPVLDGEWFEDDLVARVREFLRVTFGEDALAENLRFIEDSLGKELRKYFLSDFYKDHLQTYKKRPIYWMVQSPRKGFSALVYLHRYTRDTLNVVLNRYLREYLSKLRSQIAQLAQSLAGEDLAARERTTARQDMERLTKILAECEEWERTTLLPLAQQRMALDLDDGVKVNYLKLAAVLAPIPGLAAADE